MKVYGVALICGLLAFADVRAPHSVCGRWQSTERVSDGPNMILNVERTAGEFGGTLEMGGLTLDGKHDMRMEFAIQHVRIQGSVLIFEVNSPEEEPSVLHLEMTLKDDGEGDLKFVAEDDKRIEDGPRFRMRR